MTATRSEKSRGNSVLEGLQTVNSAINDYRSWLFGIGSWIVNTGFNHFDQHMPWMVSAFHGFGNMGNSGLFSPEFHNLESGVDVLGWTSQLGVYALAAIVVGNAVTKIGEHFILKQNGELPVKVKNGVIMADFDGGIDISYKFGVAAQEGAKANNLILARVSEAHPNRTSKEKSQFKNWAAESGTQSSAWLDSEFWMRAGASDAKSIILNNQDVDASLLAAVVIRSQVGNNEADIVIIDNDPTLARVNKSNGDSVSVDKKTKATIVNPYISVVDLLLQGIENKNGETFLPKDGKVRENEKAALVQKLESLPPIPSIYLDGNVDDGEGRGLLESLLCHTDKVNIVTKPINADMIIHFGSGKLQEDIEALKVPTEKNEKAITVSIPFFEDNEDTAISNGFDATVSIQHAIINALLPHTKQHLREGIVSKTTRQIKEKMKKRRLDL